MNSLPEKQMLGALRALNDLLKSPLQLIVGGGGAMVMAHHFQLHTEDIDAIPTKGSLSLSELDALVKQVAENLNIAKDWLNPYFASFTHVLPPDYSERLITVLNLNHLKVLALSSTDLLIMKCFAGRQKDKAHAKMLIKSKANLGFVQKHLDHLKIKNIPGVEKAFDFLDEVTE